MMKKIAALAAAALLAFATPGWGDEIDPSSYSLDVIVGQSWQWGNHNYNWGAQAPPVDNIGDLGAVEALLRDGYTFYSGVNQPATGIFSNWPTPGYHALEFSFSGGTNHTLDTLSFITTRMMMDSTPITIDYAADGGPWQTAAETTVGELGGSFFGGPRTVTFDLAGVVADQFRWSNGVGDQISIHELSISGSVAPSAVPEPGTLILLGLGTAGLGIAARRRRKKQGKAA